MPVTINTDLSQAIVYKDDGSPGYAETQGIQAVRSADLLLAIKREPPQRPKTTA